MTHIERDEPTVILHRFGAPEPIVETVYAVGCLEDWFDNDQVPSSLEVPGDTLLTICGDAECDKTQKYSLDPDQTMQIVCEGLCKKSLLQ